MLMSAENNNPNKLDKSIDLGMDQFGRFAKRRWFWLIVLSIILWYFVVQVAPQLSLPSPGTIFQYGFQIIFYMFAIVLQFVALFWFLGRPRLYWVMPGETGVGFEDYKGNPEVLEAAKRIVLLLRGIEEYQEMGGQPVRGLLLSGPPGTGKSYLAQCISTEAGVPFAYASAASFRAMFIGMDVLMIKRLYNKARRLAREYGGCVVFMDEIDAIGMSRSQRGGGQMAMGGGIFGAMGGTGGLNELLMQLDPPNIETGRFDRRVHIAAPTDKYRGEVIEFYLNKVKHDPSISLSALVARMVEYTPVAIKHVVNEAVIIAHFDGRDMVTYKDLVEAQDVHEFGLRQPSELTSLERRRLAYHEAGHAVACYYLLEREFPAYVTVHRRGDMEGAEAFAAWRPKETIKTRAKEEILARMQIALGSRAAEERFLDVNLNGVTGDLAGATTTAIAYVGMYGMDGTLSSYMGYANLSTNINPAVLPEMTKRVEEVLQSQLKAVKRLLQNHREALIAVAEALIERDELVGEEIKQLIDEADAKRVTRLFMSEFDEVLGIGNGNGHKNGNGTNGYALVNGDGHVIDAPKIVESTPPADASTGNIDMSNTHFDDSDPLFFMGG